MLSAHYFTDGAEESGEGLFHLPAGEVNTSGRLLVGSGDMISGSTGIIDRLGLFEGEGINGNYVLQAHFVQTELSSDRGVKASQPSSAAIMGNVRDTGPTAVKLLASPPSSLTRAAAVDGHMYYAPRMGDDGSTAMVIHLTSDDMVLLYNNEVLLRTGGRTPGGGIISSFGGPVVGPDGLLYCVAYTDNGAAEELMVSNGSQIRSILSSGEQLGNNGAGLISIAFGLTRDQVDGEGRLVFIGEFDDHTLSVMAGIPV